MVALGATLLAGAAFAADAPQGDALAPVGIKIGDGRLHFYLDAEGHIDSAAIYGGPAGTTLLPELIVHARGGLKFDLNTPSTLITFNGNGGLAWYTGALTSSASTSATHPTVDVGLAAAFNRDGALEFQVGDQVLYSDRTSDPAVPAAMLSLMNSAYLALPIHPGGKGLEITPRVGWAIEFFSPLGSGCPAALPNCAAALAALNYNNLNFNLNAKWRFLPKTALVVDVGFDWRTYWNTPPTTLTGTGPQALLLKGLAGLTGLITSKLSVVAMAGGGGDFTTGLATFIASAEVGWTPLENLRARVGFVRTMQPVTGYVVYTDDRPYLGVNLTFFRRLGIAVGGSFDLLNFYAAPGTAAARTDYVLTADVSPSIIVTSWFNIGASYVLSVRSTNAPAATPGMAYVRHEGILRLTFQY